MTKSDKLALCKGCDSDFYNGNNGYGIKECWHLQRAKVVRRWKLGWWSSPISPGAYREIITLDCHRESGKFAFHEELHQSAVDPITITKEKSHE